METQWVYVYNHNHTLPLPAGSFSSVPAPSSFLILLIPPFFGFGLHSLPFFFSLCSLLPFLPQMSSPKTLIREGVSFCSKIPVTPRQPKPLLILTYPILTSKLGLALSFFPGPHVLFLSWYHHFCWMPSPWPSSVQIALFPTVSKTGLARGIPGPLGRLILDGMERRQLQGEKWEGVLGLRKWVWIAGAQDLSSVFVSPQTRTWKGKKMMFFPTGQPLWDVFLHHVSGNGCASPERFCNLPRVPQQNSKVSCDTEKW